MRSSSQARTGAAIVDLFLALPWPGKVVLAALVGWLVYAGVDEARREPPQVVVDRRWDTYTTCDDEDGCTTHTDYWLVSEHGATCSVSAWTYGSAKPGMRFKCHQLFGWHGAVPDTRPKGTPEATVVQRGTEW